MPYIPSVALCDENHAEYSDAQLLLHGAYVVSDFVHFSAKKDAQFACPLTGPSDGSPPIESPKVIVGMKLPNMQVVTSNFCMCYPLLVMKTKPPKNGGRGLRKSYFGMTPLVFMCNAHCYITNGPPT